MNAEQRQQLAEEYFLQGFNCCQAVMMAFRDVTGLDEKTTLSVAFAFGGGVSGKNNWIGGISGLMRTGTISYCSNSGAVSTTNTDVSREVCLGGILGLADGTGLIDHCSNTASLGSSGAGGCAGGIVGELRNASRILQSCSKRNTIESYASVGGIAGRVSHESLTTTSNILIRGCLSQNNWLKANNSSNYNRIGGIAGEVYQGLESYKDYALCITSCISDANYYDSATTETWHGSIGGFIGNVSGAYDQVLFRSSFVNADVTTGANPRGAGYRCFNTARTVAQGCVAAGGYVGLYMMNSGDPSWIRIMNSGSSTTYNAWQFSGSGGAINESTYKSS